MPKEERECQPAPSNQKPREIRSGTNPNLNEYSSGSDSRSGKRCVLHPANSAHALEECRVFGKMSVDERRKVVENNRLCFMCLGDHFAKDCQSSHMCTHCGKRHSSLLHYNNNSGSRHENNQHVNRGNHTRDHSRPRSREQTSDQTSQPYGQDRAPSREQGSDPLTPPNSDRVESAREEFRY